MIESFGFVFTFVLVVVPFCLSIKSSIQVDLWNQNYQSNSNHHSQYYQLYRSFHFPQFYLCPPYLSFLYLSPVYFFSSFSFRFLSNSVVPRSSDPNQNYSPNQNFNPNLYYYPNLNYHQLHSNYHQLDRYFTIFHPYLNRFLLLSLTTQ